MKTAVFLLVFVCAFSVRAQQPMGEEVEAKQRKALTQLSMMDGRWRGSGWIILPTGERVDLTQTERVGPMLDGAIKVVEGRGYDAEGKTQFNAFAVISYDLKAERLTMRSHAQGRTGDFLLDITDGGYSWEIPAGPATIRYTATIQDGAWFEYGERVVPGRKPMRFFEMKLSRLGDTDWPSAGAVAFQ